MVLLIYNVIYCSAKRNSPGFFKEDVDIFFLDVSQDIIAVIGFLIYLEIIQLNFCQLSYNVRSKIIKRGMMELTRIDESTNTESLISHTSHTFSDMSDDQSIRRGYTQDSESSIN